MGCENRRVSDLLEVICSHEKFPVVSDQQKKQCILKCLCTGTPPLGWEKTYLNGKPFYQYYVNENGGPWTWRNKKKVLHGKGRLLPPKGMRVKAAKLWLPIYMGHGDRELSDFD